MLAALSSGFVGCCRRRPCQELTDPLSTYKQWHVFVSYQVVNTFAFVFNCYGKILPAVGCTTLYTSLISFAVILITVSAEAPTHAAARFVFANFVNQTGWKQNGIGERARLEATAPVGVLTQLKPSSSG